MTDGFEHLEAELAAMRPRAVSAELNQRLETTLATLRARWSDRLLIFSMTAGALAACVTAALLILEPGYQPPAPAVMIVKNEQRRPIETTLALARANTSWLEDIN